MKLYRLKYFKCRRMGFQKIFYDKLFHLWAEPCIKSVRIWSNSGLHFPAFGLNKYLSVFRVSLRIQSECVKMQTRINPNTDTFYAVKLLWRNNCFKFVLKYNMKNSEKFKPLFSVKYYPHIHTRARAICKHFMICNCVWLGKVKCLCQIKMFVLLDKVLKIYKVV